ncbi:alcohol dehydrogenase [Psychromonas sp. CNPT3]|uniref:acrylyl-CoA reductase (NADPH) n=1 Tax=Psychromonas sp. CNPT3 TaxID=314282 RepID=UPI00006E6D8C|nr:MDR family oxidoreductase [Psychromonas sp. CNPT3]AGH80683.1 alcohol dehydrogenase [Psychromonas sp. CNPT3]
MFKALVLDQVDNKTIAEVRQIDSSFLANEDVLIDVEYSSINYKDGLAITGLGRIVKNFPMIPGIDLCGRVITSKDARYAAGDNVILTGWGVGESHSGGMAEKASLKGDWLVPLPKQLSPQQAMMVGTAGLTAMLCVQALIDAGVSTEDGEILVTGASGGVGTVAIVLLSELGYKVVAASGRCKENQDLLLSLGAVRTISRETLEEPARALEKQLWAGAIDTVGSKILAKVLAQMQYNGAVAACGLAGGFDLPSTVMPFILRAVKLLGVDSVLCPYTKRVAAWQRLATLLPPRFYQQACHEITLDEAIPYATKIIQGEITGRTVIKIK